MGNFRLMIFKQRGKEVFQMGIFARYKKLARKAFFFCLKDGFARADYLRKHRILKDIGDHVYYYSRIFPSDPKLLKIHNNVVIATNVRFLGHDRIDIMLSGLQGGKAKYTKQYGCIEIMDNVFIGSDVVVLPGCRIGPNAIVGAGAVVTRDVKPGDVVGGSPARPISTFDKVVNERRDVLSPESCEKLLWKEFDEKRR